MEQLYKDQSTLRRMREGPLGAYVGAFARQMIDEGYARTSARYALQLVADFGRWLSRRRTQVPQVTAEHTVGYLRYRSGQGQFRSGDASILRRLLSLLIEQGAVAPESSKEQTPADRMEAEFRLIKRDLRIPVGVGNLGVAKAGRQCQHLLTGVLAMLVPQQQAAYRETVGSNTRSGSLRYHARHIDHRTRFDPNRPTRK